MYKCCRAFESRFLSFTRWIFKAIWSATENEQLPQRRRERAAAVWDLKFNARPQEWPLESLFCANCHSQWVAKNGQLESNHAHSRSRQLFIHTKTLLKPTTATATAAERCIGTADSARCCKVGNRWMDGFFQAVVQKDAALMCASALSRAGFFWVNTCKRELLHNDAFENKLIFRLVIWGRRLSE